MSLPQLEYVRSLPMKQLIIPETFRPTLGIGSLYKTGDQTIIEGYRSSPKYGECYRKKRGGLMQSPFCSKPGFLPGIKRERRLQTYEMPLISDTDYKRRREIEDFYEASVVFCYRIHETTENSRAGFEERSDASWLLKANSYRHRRKGYRRIYTFQYHREQCKDCFGVLHPLQYYKMEEYLYQDPPNLTSLYVKYPHRYVGYKHPLLADYDISKKLVPSSMIPYRHLAGRTSKQKDTAWIR